MMSIRNIKVVSAVSLLLLIKTGLGNYMEQSSQYTNLSGIKSILQLQAAEFPQVTARVIEQARSRIESIIATPDCSKTFANTLQIISDVASFSDLAAFAHMCYLIKEVSPDASLRAAASQALIEIHEFEVDEISKSKPLYLAIKGYYEGNAQTESLHRDQRYFLDDVYHGYIRAGLELPDEELERVKDLNKRLTKLSLEFSGNIAADASTITASHEELDGLEESFIAALKKNDDGAYILGVDYPTYFNVMENCTVSDTRKKLYFAFQNRAYPQNDNVLRDIIAKRDEMARLLGYASYAHLDLEDQMVQSPERAYEFLHDLYARATDKEQSDWHRMMPQLRSLKKSKEGKLYPWDVMYVNAQFKKSHYNIDDREIAKYFPADSTLKGLFAIYESFFNIKFHRIPQSGFWHEEVELISVASKDDPDHILGYLLLDLYPRPHKYSHAACFPIVPGQKDANGKQSTTIAGVVANFPRATSSAPALMKLQDVKTFFHEFGHALHHVLGACAIASQSGTAVKRDFVELPSQMLEEWLNDKAILKMISNHYQTGEPLPDVIIDTIIELHQFGTGSFVTRQVSLALFALDCFGPGAQKDPYQMWQDIAHKYSSGFVEPQPNTHFYASFGHLTGYAAKYYGYLWSKVFALDLFGEIKKHGLLNPEIGARYVREVLAKGGSQDPNELLSNFLQREPNSKAFFEAMGLQD